MTSETVCLCCKARFVEPDECLQHPCNPIFRMTNGLLSIELSQATKLKRTRWGRFRDRLTSLDWGYGFALTGLLAVHFILIRHFNLTISEAIFEGLGFGFASVRLLK